jgi:motility quorum-sensing regulator / GCU-specific mRNA interferase toxin
MEKRKPHYSLVQLQQLLADEHTRIITRTCKREAAEIGYFDDEAIVERVRLLSRKEFYKSMTVYGNSTLWQDVYKSADEERSLYIKLQLAATGEEKAVIIQFKTDTSKE